MKVWIEPVQATGNDGWPVKKYDVVTSDGDSMLYGMGLFASRYEAAHWARTNHQVMDVPRPKR